MALRQVNMKRMMAYSGIAQAGYLLVPFASLTILMFEQTMFYLFAYLLANMGIFAILTLVGKDEDSDEVRSFAGLFQRAPLLALSMTLFLLSLAGIPVSAGLREILHLPEFRCPSKLLVSRHHHCHQRHLLRLLLWCDSPNVHAYKQRRGKQIESASLHCLGDYHRRRRNPLCGDPQAPSSTSCITTSNLRT